jgi:hypothetical protein
MDDTEKRRIVGDIIDEIQILKDALKARQDAVVSKFNIPEVTGGPQRIATSLLAIAAFAPNTTMNFLRDLEKDLRAVKDYAEAHGLRHDKEPSLPE